MLILGAGLAGCIAGALNQEATIWEKGNGEAQHQAVLRFRSPEVGKAVGIPFKKVKVYKNICISGMLVSPDIRLSNMYSEKVTGGYYDRSISNMETEYRWIAPEGFQDMLKELCEGRIFYHKDVTDENIPELAQEHSSIISTIPIDVLARSLGRTLNISNNSKRIYVNKWVFFGAELQQTIYFPGQETSVYRATMTGDIFKVESTRPLESNEFDYILDAFGISISDTDTELLADHEQPLGKLIPINEKIRREAVMAATEDHNIYSLGRFATWRNILLDDVLDDLYKIKKMMTQDAYDKRKVTL